MRWVISSSVRLAAAIVAAAVLLLAVGVGQLRHAAVDTLPEFLPPQVQVQTEALGLSAAEVEQLITVPMEDEFNGLAYLDHLTSQSIPGLSAIQLTFKPGTDVYKARQLVTERVAQGPAVVNVGTPPVMIQPLSAESRADMVALSSTRLSAIDLSTLARWRIRPRLLAVPGVANVTIWGQRDQQLQVLVDPARLQAKGVSLTQVINTTGDAMWTSPLTFVEASSPGSDGFIDTPNQRLSIQHILPIRSPADLAKVPIEETAAGSSLRLGDVTTVVTDHPALRGDAVVNGSSGAGFLLVVEKSPGANTAAVDRGVRAAMAELSPGLAGVTVDTEAFRPASYLDDAVTNLGWAALAAIVLLVLWFGLAWRSWRVALIALFALAVPMVAAAWIQELRGTSFTALSAAGLLAGLVVVLDDAVSALAAVRNRADLPDALLAVRRPLGWALAVILLAAVPLLLVGGDNGTLTRAALFSYLLAVLAGTCTALTVTPALCWLLLRGEQPAHRPPPLARLAERAVTAAGGGLARSTAAVVACCAVLTLAALAIVPQFGSGGLLPDTQDRNLVVQWTAAPGTSLPAMRSTAERAAAQLRAVSGVRDVNSTIGQALMGDQIVDVNSGQTWITVSSGADYGATKARIQRVLAGYSGLRHELLTYAQLSLRQKQSDSRAVTVRLYGTDWGQLQADAQQVRTLMDQVPGVRGASFALPTQAPTITIDTDVAKAASVGLKPGDVRRTTAVLIAGIPVGSYYEQQQIFDVAVWSVPTVRSNLDEIRNLTLDTPSGGHVALKDIATVSITPAPVEVDHDDVSRYVDVTASVSGTDLDTAVSRVRSAVAGVALPLGSHARVLSGLETQQQDALKLILASLVCLLGIGLLFQAALRQAGRRSWGLAGLLLLSLPLSLSGGALTALIAGRHLNAGTLIGFLPVFALAVRGGMLVLRTDNGDDSVSAARDAAFPVLATTVGVLLAVLPFAVRGTVAGTELLRPEALVTAGGAVTTALVTLGLLPALTQRRRAVEPEGQPQEAVR